MTKFLHKSYSIQFNIKAQSPFFLDKQKVLWISPLLLFQALLFSSSDLNVKFEEWWIWPSLLIKSIITMSKVSSGIVNFTFDAFQESLFSKQVSCFNASSFISKLNKCRKVFKSNMTLLFRRWYEIISLNYMKSILTDSRQDKRVLWKSKIIRIKFLRIWGMLRTSRYV